MAMNCSPAFVSAIRLPSETIELRVSCDCGERAVWSWSVRSVNSGAILDEGTTDARDAAQSAAQYALERRLKSAGLQRFTQAPCKWKELLEADSSLVRFGP